MAFCQHRRETLKESWANGAFTAAFDIEMMAKNAGATGGCSVLKEIVEITYEDLFGDDE